MIFYRILALPRYVARAGFGGVPGPHNSPDHRRSDPDRGGRRCSGPGRRCSSHGRRCTDSVGVSSRRFPSPSQNPRDSIHPKK